MFYNYYKGKVAAEMMNKMGYDAMTVGNHEFDDGPEVLRDFVNAVEFPILMSNADISGEPLLKDVIQKSVVIEKGGEKIGLIGLTPQNTVESGQPRPERDLYRAIGCGSGRGRPAHRGGCQQDHRAEPFRLCR